jgi:hypothetical protein
MGLACERFIKCKLTVSHLFPVASELIYEMFYIRFDAFPASEYNEVFSGYQPGEVVQFCRDQRFEDHLCPRPQGRRNKLG